MLLGGNTAWNTASMPLQGESWLAAPVTASGTGTGGATSIGGLSSDAGSLAQRPEVAWGLSRAGQEGAERYGPPAAAELDWALDAASSNELFADMSDPFGWGPSTTFASSHYGAASSQPEPQLQPPYAFGMGSAVSSFYSSVPPQSPSRSEALSQDTAASRADVADSRGRGRVGMDDAFMTGVLDDFIEGDFHELTKQLCTNCFDKPRSVMLFPCQHLALCQGCNVARPVSLCPVCRLPVTFAK